MPNLHSEPVGSNGADAPIIQVDDTARLTDVYVFNGDERGDEVTTGTDTASDTIAGDDTLPDDGSDIVLSGRGDDTIRGPETDTLVGGYNDSAEDFDPDELNDTDSLL